MEANAGALGDEGGGGQVVTRAMQLAAITGRPLAEVERELAAEDEGLD